jgi:hypothetical protein
MRVFIVAMLLLAFVLAGCIGGDDVDPDTDEQEVDGTGRVTGTVVHAETLVAIGDVRMRLILDDEVIKETKTGPEGNFTMNNIEPGQYRLQAFHLRYQPNVVAVTVEAGETVERNLMLERMRVTDTNPYNQGPFSWSGSWCGAVTLVEAFPPASPCQSLDENHDIRTRDSPNKGLRTVVVALEWESDAATSASELTLEVANTVGAGHVYKRVTGSSPLELRIDESDIEDDQWKFSFYDEDDGPTLVLSYRVFPTTGVIWQQAFTVNFHYYYWDEAPQGASATSS